MESINELKNTQRKEALQQWLSVTCDLRINSLEPMQGDASFRRYFRLRTSTGSFVAMDAEPPQENCESYISIANALRAMGLNAPEIIAADIKQGFLLLTDFGEMTYLKALTAKNADQLYHQALNALVILQGCSEVPDRPIPLFTRDVMRQEWALHKEWFIEKLLGLSLGKEQKELDHCMTRLVESAVMQPQVFMHRDYHSANLMVLPDHRVGILDFQDAFIGPVTYDVVSLLRDCYIDWPKEQVIHWAFDYWEKLTERGVLCDIDQQEFLRWFDWMGMQRHLKALLTFARKHVRDHNPHYLHYIPRTLRYLQDVSHGYPELVVLHDYINETVQPALKKVLECVA